MARKNKKRKFAQQTTLLVVGEGPCDRAFVNHMKALYDSRENGQKVTVQSADGGSPQSMINNTVKKYAHVDYTRRVMLLDSDVEIKRNDRSKAEQAGIEIVMSTPLCLEGMLLDVLKRKVGHTSQECKDMLHPLLSGEATRWESYSPLFDKPILDETDKAEIVELKLLLSNTKK